MSEESQERLRIVTRHDFLAGDGAKMTIILARLVEEGEEE